MRYLLRKPLLDINSFLDKRLFLIVLSGILLGWLVPGLQTAKSAVPFLFGYMTLVTALNISGRGMMEVIRSPGPVAVILLLLHGVIPLSSWGWSRLFFESEAPFAVGAVLVMMVPAAVLSVIWSSLVHGEPALALAVVVLDSLLSPVILPGSIWLIFGRTVEFDTRGMITGLLWMIVLPTLLGVLLHDLSGGRLGRTLLPVNGILSKGCIGLLIAINVAAAHDSIAHNQGSIFKLLAVLTAQSLFGFFLGYQTARFCGYQPARVRTMTFSVGLRNISAGIVVALRYFSPATALPVVLAILVQQPIAASIHRWFFRNEMPSPLGSAGEENLPEVFPADSSCGERVC